MYKAVFTPRIRTDNSNGLKIYKIIRCELIRLDPYVLFTTCSIKSEH